MLKKERDLQVLQIQGPFSAKGLNVEVGLQGSRRGKPTHFLGGVSKAKGIVVF